MTYLQYCTLETKHHHGQDIFWTGYANKIEVLITNITQCFRFSEQTNNTLRFVYALNKGIPSNRCIYILDRTAVEIYNK